MPTTNAAAKTKRKIGRRPEQQDPNNPNIHNVRNVHNAPNDLVLDPHAGWRTTNLPVD